MHSEKQPTANCDYYAKEELTEWLNDFSSLLQIEPVNNRIEYPENFASGFAKVYDVEPGLCYRVVDYTMNTNCVYNKEGAGKFFLIIYFYQYNDCSNLRLSINNKVIETNDICYSTLLMTNSKVFQKLELNKGTKVKGLTIQLSEEWLRNRIHLPAGVDYNIFQQTEIFQDFLTAKTQKLLGEIFAENLETPSPILYMHSRVLRLLENFFQKILQAATSQFSENISNADFVSILKIEALLLENYSTEFPKIENLARVALMSETKLKNIFKKAFGISLYEYYQKNRMHKAKEFLSMNMYSVSEVGSMVGYQNLSNFSNAFKKEFGHLPKNSDKIG